MNRSTLPICLLTINLIVLIEASCDRNQNNYNGGLLGDLNEQVITVEEARMRQLYGNVLLHDYPFYGKSDRVKFMPGLRFKLKYRHYSGYLSTSMGQLHYWFFESESNPRNDPVVLWLNGGPGCSSLLGAMVEAGPLHLNPNGTVTPNPYSWNKAANILFLESPAGVGFSVKENKDSRFNDSQTANANYQAIRRFFLKFPYLVYNDFYMAGESYAGVFIATLAMQILEYDFPPNFKGIALGNAFLEQNWYYGAQMLYGYEHGLISEDLWSDIEESCCPANYTTFRQCSTLFNISVENAVDVHNSKCLEMASKALNRIYDLPINLYYVQEKCTKKMFNNLCIKHFDYLINWFNQAKIQRALNIPAEYRTRGWNICDRSQLLTYQRHTPSVREEIVTLMENNIKVLLFYGDQDLLCNYINAEWFIADLNLTNSHTPLDKWIFEGKHIGYYKVFPDEGLTYSRIFDAGHEALRYKPAQTQYMFNRFVDFVSNNIPFDYDHKKCECIVNACYSESDTEQDTTSATVDNFQIELGL